MIPRKGTEILILTFKIGIFFGQYFLNDSPKGDGNNLVPQDKPNDIYKFSK